MLCLSAGVVVTQLHTDIKLTSLRSKERALCRALSNISKEEEESPPLTCPTITYIMKRQVSLQVPRCP